MNAIRILSTEEMRQIRKRELARSLRKLFTDYARLIGAFPKAK